MHGDSYPDYLRLGVPTCIFSPDRNSYPTINRDSARHPRRVGIPTPGTRVEIPTGFLARCKIAKSCRNPSGVGIPAWVGSSYRYRGTQLQIAILLVLLLASSSTRVFV
eukprot:410096-Rhodomonas_salina.2